MVYDLKAMRYDPADDPKLCELFQWDKTPEGDEYWEAQDLSGITPEGQAKLGAMRKQWEAEQ